MHIACYILTKLRSDTIACAVENERPLAASDSRRHESEVGEREGRGLRDLAAGAGRRGTYAIGAVNADKCVRQ